MSIPALSYIIYNNNSKLNQFIEMKSIPKLELTGGGGVDRKVFQLKRLNIYFVKSGKRL